MKITFLCIAILLSPFLNAQNGDRLIKFQSEDGVIITADLYMIHPESAPFIVLFHQANWSRGEYNEISPELNNLGYNCLSVDLRSGGVVNNVTNQTKLNATKAMKSTQYVDALADMRAAITYAKKNFAAGKLIIFGSSYSSSLALKLAADMNKSVDAVIAFSPGEYFVAQGKPRDYITSVGGSISQPTFITSAKSEKGNWWGIYVSITSDNKTYYLPETTGNHGAKALWRQNSDSDGYWQALKSFLASI